MSDENSLPKQALNGKEPSSAVFVSFDSEYFVKGGTARDSLWGRAQHGKLHMGSEIPLR